MILLDFLLNYHLFIPYKFHVYNIIIPHLYRLHAACLLPTVEFPLYRIFMNIEDIKLLVAKKNTEYTIRGKQLKHSFFIIKMYLYIHVYIYTKKFLHK